MKIWEGTFQSFVLYFYKNESYHQLTIMSIGNWVKPNEPIIIIVLVALILSGGAVAMFHRV